MLPHFGQGCGTESAVAQYSMSSALKMWPHSVHLKCVFPLNMIIVFLVIGFQLSVIGFRFTHQPPFRQAQRATNPSPTNRRFDKLNELSTVHPRNRFITLCQYAQS